MSRLKYIIKKSWYFAWHRHHLLIPFPILKNYIKSFFRYLKGQNGANQDIFSSESSYDKWRKNYKIENIKTGYKKVITIIYIVDYIDYKQIEKTIESIMSQSDNIQLLIAINNNDDKINDILNKYDHHQYEVVVYSKDASLSTKYNDLIKKSKGEYISFIRDNMILENQLFNHIGKYINENADIIYTDEDQIINDLYSSPIFKPDWSLDSFLGNNYFGSFLTIRKKLINKVGGFTSDNFDEFIIKCISSSKNIYHIPYVLFHSYYNLSRSSNDEKEFIKKYLEYNKIDGKFFKSKYYDGYYVKYHHNNPLVSIIIPFKNQFKYTKDCVENILKNTTYKNYEIILIDNGSDDLDLISWLKDISNKHKNVIVVNYNVPFNFANICNYGVKKSHGDYLLFLNNDTKIIDKDYLDWMVGYASQNHVGAVGLKLLFEDRQVQHMGVILSLGCYANHFGSAQDENYAGHFNMCLRPYNYSAVTGACLMLSKKKFKEVNGFDEKLVVALNDVDLCIKLLDKGYKNVCLNNIKMFHFESKSRGYDDTKEKSKRLENEYKYLHSKWLKKYSEDKYYSKYFF